MHSYAQNEPAPAVHDPIPAGEPQEAASTIAKPRRSLRIAQHYPKPSEVLPSNSTGVRRSGRISAQKAQVESPTPVQSSKTRRRSQFQTRRRVKGKDQNRQHPEAVSIASLRQEVVPGGSPTNKEPIKPLTRKARTQAVR